MRVLHVTSTFPRADGDPNGPFLAHLCSAQREAGVDVRVVAPHAPGLPRHDVIGGVPVRRFRYGPARAETLAYTGGLPAAMRSPAGMAMLPGYVSAMAAAATAEARSWRADVVHAHWWVPAGLAVSSTSRLPLVITLHGSDVELATRPAVRRVARFVLHRADAVVAVSEALAARAAALTGLPRSMFGVAPMPVVVRDDVGRWPPHRRGEAARVVAVGRLTEEKGFDLLIDAVASLPDVSLTIVGDGPERAALEARAGSNVTFVGALSPAERDVHVGGADALVVPSRREGLGLVAVEAVLLGTPVVAAYTGGLPGVLGAPIGMAPDAGEARVVPGGVLVRPEDAEGLAAGLRLVVAGLAPPGGAALSAAQRHDPAEVAAEHVRLYLSVLARS